jgi:penicillin-binding protein 1A
LRWALTKSRNLVSIRLLQRLGVARLIEYSQRLGFDTSSYAPALSLALGTQSITPLELATGYALLANGGYRVEPHLIQRVENLEGEIAFEARPLTVCPGCDLLNMPQGPDGEMTIEAIMAGENSEAPGFPPAPRVQDARVNYIIDSILKDVIKKGTGRRALALKRSDIAGKTGTTNGPMDVWFSGYNQAVVTTVWVGFDNYTPLGRKEFGGTAALPIWIEYMRTALKDSPQVERPVPPGIVTVKIDPDNGLLAAPGQRNAVFEYFLQGSVPEQTGRAQNTASGDDDISDQINDIF